MSKLLRIIILIVPSILAALVLLAYFYWRLSLPVLTGEVLIRGDSLAKPLESIGVARDSQGIPSISASSRVDVAFALGFLHGQERYFQMDTLRRTAAGELSELFGRLALNFDKNIRIHRFRVRAQRAVDALGESDKQLLQSYTNGVNAGLDKLGAHPFEYALLQHEVTAWQTADTFLVLYAMYIDLQPENGEFERSLTALQNHLPSEWFEFIKPGFGNWDAPISDEQIVYDRPIPESTWPGLISPNDLALFSPPDEHLFGGEFSSGSNNWAITGDLSKNGSAMLACDMHLGLRVPNIWYRANWGMDDGRRVTGVTLPGTPLMIVGSNEHIAWGFTNSYGDWSDLIPLELNTTGDGQKQYRLGQDWKALIQHDEVIKVKGEADVVLRVYESEFGPLVDIREDKAEALRWVAHDIEGANIDLLRLEKANSVNDALNIAASAGTPQQNFVVADKNGEIAWTVMGRIPERSVSAQEIEGNYYGASAGWTSYLNAEDYPQVQLSENGRLWTANSRVVGGQKLKKVGVGGYAIGSRASQIKTRLLAQAQFDERDLLDIQLDDDARFMQTWMQIMLSVVDDKSEVASLLKEWDGHASADSIAYRLVRNFRYKVTRYTLGEVFQGVKVQADYFSYGSVSNLLEAPTWRLMEMRPPHLVPEGFDTWKGFLRQMADDVLADAKEISAGNLENYRWGKLNALRMEHPLSQAVPLLSSLLDMEQTELPGGPFVPRVQTSGFGASQRMIVSPGFEAQGIMQMPGGQSGHPLSPYYSAGHADWVEGKASSFLPGETKWRLELVPGTGY